MLTIALTYRNRDLRIVENNFISLEKQSDKRFKVILVDYGSTAKFKEGLSQIVRRYDFIELITCPFQQQLWNKSRAINMVLKRAMTPYFLVADIDLIFHPDFVKITNRLAKHDVFYFQCGFLSKKESLLKKEFNDYEVAFKSNAEATGITRFPTNELISIGGFDEFYHGWGSEDTDVHIRMAAKGLDIHFYDTALLVKHQWHPKIYRTKNENAPFHTQLERINQHYLKLTKSRGNSLVNHGFSWGELPVESDYDALNSRNVDHCFDITSLDVEFFAFLGQLKLISKGLVRVRINDVSLLKKKSYLLKKVLKQWNFIYLDMEIINNLLLEEIIKNYRNKPYMYSFNREIHQIECVILFK